MNRRAVYLVLPVLCLSAPGLIIIACGQVQTTHVKVIRGGDDWQCPSVEERERARNEIRQTSNMVIAHVTGHVYTCNGTPGWRRVAFINMTNTSYNCPTGLSLTPYSKRTCGRVHTTDGGCSSTTFSVGGLPYSQVCGRIRGYQFGATSAFHSSSIGVGIDSYYVDGVSLTHGVAGNRQHIWTFAAAVSEVISNTTFHRFQCPCDDDISPSFVPSFVGNDYFCESGVNSEWSDSYTLYSDDVLWDGEDCTSTSTCCQLNNPPWFIKSLPSETTDDIELRLCTNHPSRFEDVPIELIELYVQ